ncbi:inositol monophosphatase family protein, partial [Streptomyces niveus]
MINSHAGVDDVDVATAAVSAGAEVVRARYGQRFARIDKGAGDFATDVDVAAEEAILGVIRAVGP